MAGNEEPIVCPLKKASDDEYGKKEGYDYHQENLEIFKDTVVPWMKTLEDLVTTSQEEEVRSKLHAIRSLCHSVGARRLGKKVGELEDELMCKKREVKACFPEELIAIFNETIKYVTEVVEKRANKEGP